MEKNKNEKKSNMKQDQNIVNKIKDIVSKLLLLSF